MLLLLLLLQEETSKVASMSWIQAAIGLSSDLESLNTTSLKDAGFNTSADAVSKVAAARGATVNTIRRQVASAKFLASVLSPAVFQGLLEGQPPPFNTVEVLKRIHDIDADLAKKLLPENQS